MQIIEYHELDKIPDIEQLDQCETLEQAKQWFEDHKSLKLTQHHHWTMPQLVAKLRLWQLVTKDNRVLAKETLHKNLQDPKQRRYYWQWQVPRGCWIQNQNQNPQYAQLTPLLLLAHKQEYSYQSWQGLECLEPWLRIACALDHEEQARYHKFQSNYEQLQTWYHQSLAGKPARSQTRVFRCGELGLPMNTQILLLQHWLACSSVRHPDQILDPLRWDHQPKAIQQVEPLKHKIMPSKSKPTDWRPW